ncbi:MFS general substrate transporter, partial [Peniophora sp. CONT]
EAEDTAQLNESSLAPIDGGWRAWSFLTAAFMVELAIWGFPNAFGVFLEAYLRDASLTSQPHANSLLPLAGTLSSGIIFCTERFTGAVTYPLSTRYPYYRRHAMWIGVVVCWSALFGASFAKTVSQLVFFQGVLYALGASILYAPSMSYLAEWFARRRGLASGVIDAGTAAGGLIFPLFLPQVIEAHGTSLTLRYISYGFLGVMIPSLAMIKPRLPERRTAHGPGPRSSASDKSWMRSSQFWLVVVANTVQGFGYFLPQVWLPTYASALNISASKASLTVAMLNGASLLSRLALGTLSDYFAPWLLAAITLSTASLATFIFWGV